jgi:hypothetical protein
MLASCRNSEKLRQASTDCRWRSIVSGEPGGGEEGSRKEPGRLYWDFNNVFRHSASVEINLFR